MPEEPQWQVTVSVPERLPSELRESLFDRIVRVAHGWEPEERDGWDADVSGGSEWVAVTLLNQARCDRELLRWLHAEAVHRAGELEQQRDSLAAILERMDTEHTVWRGPDGQEIHPDWCRECRVSALKAAIADIDAHATPVGLLNNDDPDGSPHHYVLTVGALHRALGKAYTAEPCEAERARLRIEVDRLRREVEFEANGRPVAVNGLSLPVCACISDDQAAQLAEAGTLPSGRPAFTRPVCAVHQVVKLCPSQWFEEIGGAWMTCQRDAKHPGIHVSGDFQWPNDDLAGTPWTEGGEPDAQ